MSPKAKKIQAILEQLFPKPPIPLDHTDPFTLLVAVLLSAQTTDKKVNEVTPALFDLADTPQKMASLTVEQILSKIRVLGLAPTKAKHLKRMAEQLIEHHNGRVPRDQSALEALAGVGRKTAQVVMSQAFGLPAFPVDTHIHRLAERWGLSNGKSALQTERDLKRIFPEHTWNDLHLRIIYFGRQYCPARNHDPSACPICSWATAHQSHANGGAARSKSNSRKTKTKRSSTTTKAKITTSKATARSSRQPKT